MLAEPESIAGAVHDLAVLDALRAVTRRHGPGPHPAVDLSRPSSALGTAWRAWQDADGRLARMRAVAVFPVSRAAATPAPYADREDFLRRTVLATARRELPIAAVADALAGRKGWNLHSAEQESHIHRAVAAHLAQRYRQAATAERLAWHTTTSKPIVGARTG